MKKTLIELFKVKRNLLLHLIRIIKFLDWIKVKFADLKFVSLWVRYWPSWLQARIRRCWSLKKKPNYYELQLSVQVQMKDLGNKILKRFLKQFIKIKETVLLVHVDDQVNGFEENSIFRIRVLNFLWFWRLLQQTGKHEKQNKQFNILINIERSP